MDDLQVTVAMKTGDSVAFGTVMWLRDRRLSFEANARSKEGDNVELRMELRGRSDTVYALGHVASRVNRHGAVPVFVVGISQMSPEDEARLAAWLEDLRRGGTSANVEGLINAKDVVTSSSYSTSDHETANALRRYDEKRSRFRKKDDKEADPMGLKSSGTGSSASFQGAAGRNAIRSALRKGVSSGRTAPKPKQRASGDPASSAWLKKLHGRMGNQEGESWSHWERRAKEASERRTRPVPLRTPEGVDPSSIAPVSTDSEAASADEYTRWIAEQESLSKSQASSAQADLRTRSASDGPVVPSADEVLGRVAEPDPSAAPPVFAPPPERAPDPPEPAAAVGAPPAQKPEAPKASRPPEPVPEARDHVLEGLGLFDDATDPACFLDVDAMSAMITWAERQTVRDDWNDQLQHGSYVLSVAPPHPSAGSALELVLAFPDGQFATAQAVVMACTDHEISLDVIVTATLRQVFTSFG